MKKYQTRWLLAALSQAALAPSVSHAQTTGSVSSLPEVVVSASLLEQLVTDALPATTLITRQDIERAQASDLPSLLRQQAGVELGQLGGRGGVSTAFVRGAESRHLVVLIDGLPTSSLNFSLAALEHLSLADVERIEIVRGNVSSIYGSAAMGGLVQIFTGRKVAGPWLETKAELGSRGFNSAQLSTGVRTVSGLQISGSIETLEGGKFNSMNQSQKPGTNPDLDGYNRTAGAVRISREWDGGKVVFSTRESKGEVRYDSDGGPASQADESTHVLRSTQLASSWRLLPALTLDVSAGQGEERVNAKVTAYPYYVYSRAKTLTTGAAWRLRQGHTLTAGLEATRQDIESDTAYDLSRRDLDSSRAGYQYSDERHQLQLNLRQDRYSGSVNARTWYAGYALQVTPAWRLMGSKSTGFMTPTFNDLFYPGYSNPNLRPERSRSQEFGVQYVEGGHDLRLTSFRNRYSDLIASDANFQPANIASAANEGVEILYRGQFQNNLISGGLTSQDPRNLTSGQTLNRRAKLLANASYSRRLGAWETGAQLRYQGSRMDGKNPLGSYVVVDLLASRKLTPELTLFGRVENAFDRDYQTNYGYNTHGRGLFVGLKWAPKI